MLILNDEQEKALREWFRTWPRSVDSEGNETGLRGDDLYDAITSLMKWRVGGKVPVVVTNGINEIQVIGLGFRELTERICRLLNDEDGCS